MAKGNRQRGVGIMYDGPQVAIDKMRDRDTKIFPEFRSSASGHRRCVKCKGSKPTRGGSIFAGGTRFKCAECKQL